MAAADAALSSLNQSVGGNMHIKRFAASTAAVFLLAFASPADAEDTILTVTGNITAGAEVNMTLSDIEALGSARIVTTTPWHDGKVTFEGVPMSRLMEAVGANGTVAFVLALNNYSSEVPLSDFTRFEPILAYKKDGRVMGIADKGPLFIIYPYDDVAELKSELYYSRSAWQVRSIEIQ
jgi:hypothetical protein